MWLGMLSTSKAGSVRCAFSSARRPAGDREASEFIAACVEEPLSLVSARSGGEWPGRACSSSIVLAEIRVEGDRCVPLVLQAHTQPFSHCAPNSAEGGRSQPSFSDFAIGEAFHESGTCSRRSQSASQQRLQRN
ncbi:hypothetical protein HYPDE_25178 [Hyphomicrobium denitrificans 1NES1]|uniref:Uncharacterized protein n=1 Tax=Hyphomicrobium denitrificans 1NES1 TaxID=670307 RepID=N0B9G4_9HYPH|nr:hypothetical protein HYPDE_25178 [Hyphomicrobium denitrificans 1NES1]